MSTALKNKNNIKLINKLSSLIPQFENRLKKSDEKTNLNLKYIIANYNLELPEDFRDLYSVFDGENNDKFLGTILGFSLMSSRKIVEEIKGFNEMDFEFISMKTKFIKDGDLKNKIPFAFDGSRCFIAIDMDPGPLGKVGQIITVDFDYDKYYLLADSLEEFYTFIDKMLSLKKCTVEVNEDNEPYFLFESGHLFNELDEILNDDNSEEFITVDDTFWKDYFKEDISDNKISSNILNKVTRVMIKEGDVSLKILQYMQNLRELIIHNSQIKDFEFIEGAKELRKLYLVNSDFSEESFNTLKNMPNLNEISLNKLKLKSTKDLNLLKSLKDLSLNKLENFDYTELKSFKTLKTLSIDEPELKDYDFLNEMNSLVNLSINSVNTINNIDFLKNLKKLRKFELESAAQDEDGLKEIAAIEKIKEFKYPVKDMVIYKGFKNIKAIGIDIQNAVNLEALKGSNINSVTFYNVNDDKEVKEMSKKLKEYINLSSTSYRCPII